MTKLIKTYAGYTCEFCQFCLKMKIGAGVLQGICQHSKASHYGHVVAPYHPACEQVKVKDKK